MTITPLGPHGGYDNPTIEQKIKFPGSWWDEYSNSRVKKGNYVKRTLPDSDYFIISDNDLDGLGSVAILESAYDNVCRGIVDGRKSEGETFPSFTMNFCAKLLHELGSNQDVYMVDLCPNEENVDEILEYFEKYSGDIYVYDHHEWDDEIYDRFENSVTQMDVRTGEKVCGADILYDNIKEDIEVNRKIISRLVAAIRDHDIWIKETEESYNLSELHHESEENEFVEILKYYGADVMNNKYFNDLVTEKRYQKHCKMEAQVKKSNWYFFDNRGYREVESQKEIHEDGILMAFSYGCAYHSGVGNVLCEGWGEWIENSPFNKDGELVEEVDYSTKFRPGDADIVAIIKPWDKVSFRSSEDYPICHKIADNWEGGGHEQAASCRPGIVDEIGYSQHWMREGEFVIKEMIEEMPEVLQDV